MKLCSKLRAFETELPQCKHFPKTERIDRPWHKLQLKIKPKLKLEPKIEPKIDIDVNIDVAPRFSLRAYAAAQM
jgi:hypothetical protein